MRFIKANSKSHSTNINKTVVDTLHWNLILVPSTFPFFIFIWSYFALVGHLITSLLLCFPHIPLNIIKIICKPTTQHFFFFFFDESTTPTHRDTILNLFHSHTKLWNQMHFLIKEIKRASNLWHRTWWVWFDS